MFIPKLEILPAPQREVWAELRQTSHGFVLYGGTAIALRLGHRQSIDFDFFTNGKFAPEQLLRDLPNLRDGRVDQRGDNTLVATIMRSGPVRLSFFGDVQMRSVQSPDRSPETGIEIASLMDLTATKLKTIQQRAEAKDYIDLAAAFDAGIALTDALASAMQIYGKTFNAVAALKSLSYFGDGNLSSLPPATQGRLHSAARSVKLPLPPRQEARRGITLEEAE